MNTPVSRGELARRFYNAAASTADDFSFMNYGFAPLTADLAAADEPERYCLQLYRHLLGNVDLAGRQIVEVSCGRGGGAAHLAQVYRPAQYLGIDISEENVAIASRRFAEVANLRFEIGNAEDLPLPTESCDALVNVEAAHLYDNPARFFSEAERVLRKGGGFYHADLCWQDKDPVRLIADAGFLIASVGADKRSISVYGHSASTPPSADRTRRAAGARSSSCASSIRTCWKGCRAEG